MEELNLRTNNSNQVIDFNYGGDFYRVHLFSFKGLTFADISLNGEDIVNGLVCVPSQNLIQSQPKSPQGNFRFICVDNDYPYFTKFNKSQRLVFYTIAELESLSQ